MDIQGIAALVSSVAGLLAVILPSIRVLFNRIRETHVKVDSIETNVETLLIRTQNIMKEMRKLSDGKHRKELG